MDIAFIPAGYKSRRGRYLEYIVVATDSAEDIAAQMLVGIDKGPRLFDANGSTGYALRIRHLPNDGSYTVFMFFTSANVGASKREKARLYCELKKRVRQIESAGKPKVERQTRRQLHIHSREARW